jgi:hypothetical protein
MNKSLPREVAHTKCGLYLLASLFAAALPDGLFEHPAAIVISTPFCKFQRCIAYKPSFSAVL